MVIVHLGHVALEEHHHLKLFEAYARQTRVVYLEMGRRGEPPASGSWTDAPGLERRRVVPVIPGNRLPPVARWNWWLGARAVLAALRRQGIADIVLVTQKPDTLPTLRGLDADLTLYQIVDDFVALAEPLDRPRVRRAHRRMLRQADSVWATSKVLVEEAAGHCPEVHPVTHEVDYAPFAAAASAPPPPFMAAVAAPRVGSVGKLNDRIDWGLIEGIARARPAWSIVFVGPVYHAGPPTLEAVARLRRLPNVHFLPEVPPEDLPGAIAGLDVGLIPYAPGPGTLAINPLKLYQYLSAGRPVVATPLPRVMDFRDVVAIAADVGGFVAAVEAALTAPDAAARADDRRRRAREFDAENVAAHRLGLLRDALGRRGGRPPAPTGGAAGLPIR